MRKAEPWYWAKRKGWYVQINGKQLLLAKDESPKKGKGGTLTVPQAAKLAYHRLMAVAGKSSADDIAGALVPDVCEVFLGLRSGVSAAAMKLYVYYLRALSGPYMTRKFVSLRPADVTQAAESQTTWGVNTKRAFIANISALFRWAKKAGYTEVDVMAGYGNPYPSVSRTRVLTNSEFQQLIDHAKDLGFKQITGFIRACGCRPGEARKITAAHVHPDKPIVTLAWNEHKTGKKTKRPRLIYMPADIETMVRSLAKLYPEGALFRNSQGRRWALCTLSARFTRYRRELGWGEDVCPYTLRHTGLTNMLDSGMSLHHTATAAGHTGTNILMKVYYHPDEDVILEGVDKASKKKSKPK